MKPSKKHPSYLEPARLAHHKALEALSVLPKPNGLSIWRKLRRVEGQASLATAAYCNDKIDLAACDAACRKATCAVIRILGHKPVGFFVNRDPLGYALKLDSSEGALIPPGLARDWGGYGILAAIIE